MTSSETAAQAHPDPSPPPAGSRGVSAPTIVLLGAAATANRVDISSTDGYCCPAADLGHSQMRLLSLRTTRFGKAIGPLGRAGTAEISELCRCL